MCCALRNARLCIGVVGMAVSYGLIAAGALLLVVGIIGIGLHRNELYSAARI
jgi:hypothetical protein